MSTRSRRSFGHTRKLPSGRWQATYAAPDGSRRKAPSTFPNRKAADDWLADIRSTMLRGQWHDPARAVVTFGAYADQWLITRDLAPRTLDLYRRLLARWVARELPDPTGGTVHLSVVPVGRLDLPTVRGWFAAVTAAAARSAADTGPRDRRAPARVWADSDAGRAALTAAGVDHPKPTGRLSPAVLAAWQRAGSPRPPSTPRGSGKTQAAQAYRLVRAICTTAVDDGLLSENPCRVPRAGTVRADERPTLDLPDVDRLAAAMPAHLAASVHLAAWSGLRASELFALDRARVNLDAGTLRVDRSLTVVGGRSRGFGPPKSDAGYRVVHLPGAVLELLSDHMATHTGPGADALVFANPTTRGPILDATRNRAFVKARKATGLENVHWHDLRHVGATLAAQAGATTRELQRRFGHSTAAAAMIYQHADDLRDRELAAALDNLVDARRRRLHVVGA